MASVLPLTAQTYHSGPQVLTFLSSIDDSDQPYAIYLPKDLEKAAKWPLVISLHGAGSNPRLNLRRVLGKGNLPGETDAEATRYFPAFPQVPYIVACPLARGSMGYQGVPEQDVYDVLADVEKRFPIDADRVYLTGVSMGGGGALWLGLTRPDLWAAIAPVCAAAPEEARPLAPNALHVPVALFHGSVDPIVPAESSRRWQHDLLEAGVPVQYTEYPNVRHNSWDSAYKNEAIFDWFGKFRRNRMPDRVHFVTDRYRYRSAYWVELDGLTPGTLASLDARFTGPNQLSIQTSHLDAFTLKLNGHPRYEPAHPLQVKIDGFAIRPVRGTSFARGPKGWVAAKYELAPTAKRPGAEGPVSAAVSSQQIYVYGTAGSPSADDLAARREEALRGADWSSVHSKLALFFRVVADAHVRPSDLENANLVLFGTKETNLQIARLAARLPIALNVSAADYGLVYVYPAGKHYVLVNSGVPWWHDGEFAKRGGLPFVPEKLRILQSLEDFVLFKGSIEHVIAEGRFTNDWTVPEEPALRMRKTGAVEVR